VLHKEHFDDPSDSLFRPSRLLCRRDRWLQSFGDSHKRRRKCAGFISKSFLKCEGSVDEPRRATNLLYVSDQGNGRYLRMGRATTS
jgi:hypothetical protein